MRSSLNHKKGAGVTRGAEDAGEKSAGARPSRFLLIVNDKSGRRDRSREVLRLFHRAGTEPSMVSVGTLRDRRTKGIDPTAVDDLAKRCRDEGIARVVVAGGDGSIAPAAWVALRATLPLAIVPTGTANSLARWLGLPVRSTDAVALATGQSHRLQSVELAEAAGQPFVNLAATGLSVLASKRAKPLKRRFGAMAYAIGAALAAARGKPFKASVICDGAEVWSGRAWQILVAASGAFGGASATGGVDPEDQRLDVAILEESPRLALLKSAFAMRQGRLVDEEAVRHFRGRKVEIGMRADATFNVDGDLMKLRRPSFSILGQIEVVVPPAANG